MSTLEVVCTIEVQAIQKKRATIIVDLDEFEDAGYNQPTPDSLKKFLRFHDEVEEIEDSLNARGTVVDEVETRVDIVEVALA